MKKGKRKKPVLSDEVQSEMMTVREVAQYLHCHFFTVYRLIRQNALPGFRLGGRDWDNRLVDFVAAHFQRKFGEDPRAQPQSLAALVAAAERAKRTLSKLQQTSITCTHAGKMLTVPLTRADFEAMTRDGRVVDTSTLAAYALLLMAERRGEVTLP